jgi:hypothetical protein
MKAVLCRSFGPPENLTLEEVAEPRPGVVMFRRHLVRRLNFLTPCKSRASINIGPVPVYAGL